MISTKLFPQHTAANALNGSIIGSISFMAGSTRPCGQHEEAMQGNAVIAERLRNRDPQIMDYLILQYQHRLLRYLVYLTGDRALSEDLFQETWMRVLVRGGQFRGNSQFVTWLFSIARNLVFDLKRRRSFTTSFDEVIETRSEQSLQLPTQDRTPFDLCASLEDGRLIDEMLSALTPQQRQMLMLRFQEELSLKEIASLTGVPLSTVKARLYRGLTVLRSHMTAAMRPITTQKTA
jgi:RNA polymerase sigma-70 factor (ECF subfamily)